MRAVHLLRRSLALLVALAIPLTSLPSFAQTPPKGDRILEGKIMSEEGKAIEKAVVKVRNLDTGEEFSSQPTGANGSYKFNRLPPGRYEVAVQTERGVYLGNRTVDLVNKEAQSYSFSLKSTPPEEALEQAKAARGQGAAPEAGGRPAITPSEKMDPTSIWRNPLTATLLGVAIAVGAAILIDEARDDDDDDASPSAP